MIKKIVILEFQKYNAARKLDIIILQNVLKGNCDIGLFDFIKIWFIFEFWSLRRFKF
jgi:hypothetical protein